MELGAQIIYYTIWLVVAIAAGGIIYHSLRRRDLRRDRAALSEAGAKVAREVSPILRLLRERTQPMTAIEREDFRVQRSKGIRVAFWLMIPLLILGYRWGGKEWGLLVALVGLIYVPVFTLPFSIAHTYLLRLAGHRGAIVSTAIGALLGLIVGWVARNANVMPVKLALIYGAVYGLIVGLGNTSLYAPGLIADDRPRTLEEQAKADGLIPR